MKYGKVLLAMLILSSLLLAGCGNQKIEECVKACAKDKIDIPAQYTHWKGVCERTEYGRGEQGLNDLIHYCQTGEEPGDN